MSSNGGWTDRKTSSELLYNGIMNSRKTTTTNSSTPLFDKFSRFGIIDPYNTLTGAKEYLFFTKPDFNLFSNISKVYTRSGNYKNTTTQDKKDKMGSFKVRGATGFEQSATTTSSGMNSYLKDYPFFIELADKYPKVAEQLQYSIKPSEPFMKLLSNSVRSSLDLPDISTRQIETAQTAYGTSIQYEADDFSTDEGFSFDLEFEDTKYIEVYMLFKAWHEYLRKKSFGVVEPIDFNYRIQKILHDQIAIFKFIVAEDGETIVHYSKLYGCRPQGVPRSTFSDLGNNIPIKFSVPWRAEFVEDMNPLILADFNDVSNLYSKGTKIEIYDSKNMRSNMEMARYAKVVESTKTRNRSYKMPEDKVYKLKWYK